MGKRGKDQKAADAKRSRAEPDKEEYRGIQQDDNYREFMGWITKYGLRYAYARYQNLQDAEEYKYKEVSPAQRRHVIVVGAGMSGLAAAYELAQVGHKVTILEVQSRVGGRVKTFREGFHDGLHCEGGAMRLPPNHYLTHHYLNLFGLKTRTFKNYNENAYLHIYGEKIRIKDWNEKNDEFTTKFWPGWDEALTSKTKTDLEIRGILDYYERTMKPVKNELTKNSTERDWQAWVRKWSKYSVEDFLRSGDHQEGEKYKLRPWPEAAIQAYKVSTYTPLFSQDLASYLREELGEWWKDPLTTPESGMDSLPKSFLMKNLQGWNQDIELSKNIKYGVLVQKVECLGGTKGVKIIAKNQTTREEQTFEGDAVILTLPFNILRQLDVTLPIEKVKALEGITYGASTKIMLQCKTRFWQPDVGKGGFSKSNMLMGQLHYPGHDEDNVANDERGILLVYTWDQQALTFGSEKKDLALLSVVNEISKIHPEIKEEFEVGHVQAWFSDPAAQGAYAALRPFEYVENMDQLIKPNHPIYLAGEALSWSNGWIQGAIFSGLMQAFCFQFKTEKPQEVCRPVALLL